MTTSIQSAQIVLDMGFPPPGAPMVTIIVSALREFAEAMERQGDEAAMDLYHLAFRDAAVAWTRVSTKGGLIERVLDYQDQTASWLEMPRSWDDLVKHLLPPGETLAIRFEHVWPDIERELRGATEKVLRHPRIRYEIVMEGAE